jgi:hypothetical protein
MLGHGYYEGFHFGPGKRGTKKSPPFIEEASDAEARAKNIGDYARALSRTVRTVRGEGGVPDPSPGPASTIGKVVAFFLIAGATFAAARWL